MFYREVGNSYISYSEDTWNLSPAYVVASACRRLIEAGHHVALPGAYDVTTLEHITWLTGRHLEHVKVSARQAQELAQIARTLQEDHAAELTPAERSASADLCSIVESSASKLT